MRDELFREDSRVQDFGFDQRVTAVFDDMLDRSVPFYREVQRIAVELGTEFLSAGGTVYDIGCATGNTILGFLEAIPADRPVKFIGIEPSAAMRTALTEKLATLGQSDQVVLRQDSIETLECLPGARVILMLYTLQFVRPLHRERVLRMLHDSLEPGGCLLLAEKIVADNSMLSRLYIDFYHDFKRRAGYSTNEIARKREALENVLVPYRDNENRAMLREVGFRIIDQVFRWYTFALYLAIKN